MTEDVRQLDCTSDSRGVWLMKVPKTIGESMKRRAQGVQLGTVHLAATTDGKKRGRIVLSDAIGGDRTSDYNMSFVEDVGKLMVFSENAVGDYSIEGTVVEKCDCVPDRRDLLFRGMIQKKSLESQAEGHITQVMDEREVKKRRNLVLKPTAKGTKPAKPKGSEWEVRARIDEGELRSKLFKLFGKTPRWTFKELNAKVEQPDVFLKQVLSSMAVYNSSGPNRGSYELTQEFGGEGKIVL